MVQILNGILANQLFDNDVRKMYNGRFQSAYVRVTDLNYYILGSHKKYLGVCVKINCGYEYGSTNRPLM